MHTPWGRSSVLMLMMPMDPVVIVSHELGLFCFLLLLLPLLIHFQRLPNRMRLAL